MAFCTSCGAPIEGRFCTKCGASAGSPAPAAVPPVAAAAAPVSVPPKKKTSPLVWVLVGVLGLIVIGVIAVGLVGAYFVHKVKQNPAQVLASLVVRNNPDLEMLSSDTGRGTVTFRDKKTGKVVTMNFDDIKRGKFSFQEEGKEAVTMEAQGSGDSGTFEMRSGGQVAKFGAGADKVPSWVPTYPGAKIEGTFSMQGGEGQGGSFQLTTKDSVDKVMAHYESALKGAGFTVPTTVKSGEGGMVMGQNNEHTVHVTVGQENGETKIATIYSTKK